MAIIPVNDPRYTDLVLAESVDLGNYYSRDIVTVTPSTATGTYPLGTVIFRAKAVDDSAAWDVLDAAGDLSVSNEYALVIGDSTGVKPEGITLTTSAPSLVTVIARDARVKASAIDSQPLIALLTSANRRDLKGLLRKQSGIKVEATESETIA